MKKEFLLLCGIILILSSYLLFKTNDNVHYTLPILPEINTNQVDRIKIEQNDIKMELIRTEKGWFVGDKKFKADEAAVEKMLNIIKNMKISALVSEHESLTRYGLDADHLIGVSAFTQNKKLMEVMIGKIAPSSNHTFISLGQDKSIYHAQENFRSDFEKTVEDLRDKQVLNFQPDSITKIILSKSGTDRVILKNETFKAVEKNEEGSQADKWIFSDNTIPDQEVIYDLLSDLSFLECETFIENRTLLNKQSPYIKIILENTNKIILNIFHFQNKFQGISSMNQYAFNLSSYTAQNIDSLINKLLGLDDKAVSSEVKTDT